MHTCRAWPATLTLGRSPAPAVRCSHAGTAMQCSMQRAVQCITIWSTLTLVCVRLGVALQRLVHVHRRVLKAVVQHVSAPHGRETRGTAWARGSVVRVGGARVECVGGAGAHRRPGSSGCRPGQARPPPQPADAAADAAPPPCGSLPLTWCAAGARGCLRAPGGRVR